jgi:mRNA-degrading endonuclease YafQ of YafQ-DinJ toxin-antitoxin module
MYKLIITSKFKRAFRKFARRNADLQARIEETIAAMENDIFAANLGTHKLEGKGASQFCKKPTGYKPGAIRTKPTFVG